MENVCEADIQRIGVYHRLYDIEVFALAFAVLILHIF